MHIAALGSHLLKSATAASTANGSSSLYFCVDASTKHMVLIRLDTAVLPCTHTLCFT
jgi:hypothetical protein